MPTFCINAITINNSGIFATTTLVCFRPTYKYSSQTMKHKIIITLLLTTVLASCKKKDDTIEPFVAAKTGNFNFFASGKMVTSTKTPSGVNQASEIQGVMPSGATIKLWMRNFSGMLETYPLDSTLASASYTPETPSVEKISVHGSLTITSVTPAIRGTFTFTCPDSSVVSGDFGVNP